MVKEITVDGSDVSAGPLRRSGSEASKSLKKLRILLRTFGCQMNERDSEVVFGALLEEGYVKANSMETADVILFNTCSVREHAEQRIFGRFPDFERLKTENPAVVIGIIGCMAQQQGDLFFQKTSSIDFVCGPGNLSQIPLLLRQIQEDRQKRLAIDKLNDPYDLVGHYRQDLLKALVTIMTGCDNHCTYCVVPNVRGVERSRDPESILREIQDLAIRGFKDVMLLGQNVNSYGKGLKEPLSFVELLKRIYQKAPQLLRLRFMTSHPKDISDDLIECMRDLPPVCEHLHLPVQSGSDSILKRMGRGHTAQEYLKKINQYRKHVPQGSLTTDFIVGFPGETESDFKNTLKLAQEAQFDSAYIFEYSSRPGTPGAKLKDDLPAKEKRERHQELLKTQRAVSFKKNQLLIGRTMEVLFESHAPKNKDHYVGRTRSFKRVVAFSDNHLTGLLTEVRMTAVADETLIGEVIS